MPALKLSPFEPTPLAVSLEILLETLNSGLSSMEAICQELKCTPDDLAATLADPHTSRLLHIKTRLAATQVHLMAVQYMPHAIRKLQILAETAEKPEVVRRSATTLINMAGIPTATARHPAPPPVAPPDNLKAKPEEIPDKDEVLDTLANLLTLKRAHGLDINNVPQELYPRFTQALHDFFIANRIPFYCEYIENPYDYLDEEQNEDEKDEKDKNQDQGQTQNAKPNPTPNPPNP